MLQSRFSTEELQTCSRKLFKSINERYKQQMQIGYYASGNPNHMVEGIVRAERAGFDTAWVGDHFAFWFPEVAYPEPWSTLAAAAVNTNTIRLGPGVTDPFRRSPTLIAQSSATLDVLSGGRGFLGIGAGEPMNLLPYGIEYSSPAHRVKETVKLVREFWSSSWLHTVTYSGRFNKLKDAFIQIHPVKGKSMPIYIAGSGPIMRRVAGELGDGWYSYIQSPETYSEDLKEVREGAVAAKREFDDIDTVAWMDCAVSKYRELAKQTIIEPAGIGLILAQDKLSRLGIEVDLPKGLALNRVLMTKQGIDLLHEYAKKIPISAIEQTAAFGTPDDCLSLFEKFAKAGAKHIVVLLLGDLKESFNLFESHIVPHLHSI